MPLASVHQKIVFFADDLHSNHKFLAALYPGRRNADNLVALTPCQLWQICQREREQAALIRHCDYPGTLHVTYGGRLQYPSPLGQADRRLARTILGLQICQPGYKPVAGIAGQQIKLIFAAHHHTFKTGTGWGVDTPCDGFALASG